MRPVNVTSDPAASARSSSICGPSPAIVSGRPIAAHAVIASAKPFSGVSLPAASAKPPSAAAEPAANSRCTEAITCARSNTGAPSSRNLASANELGTTNASTHSASRRCHSASDAP